MPQKKSSRRLITPLLLFTVAGWALWALGRNQPSATLGSSAEPSGEPHGERDTAPSAPSSRTRAPWSKRRLATSLAFVTLFFGGAAFSAGAGDVVAEALEGDSTEMTTTEEQAEEPDSEEPSSEEPAPEEPAEPAEETPAEGEEPDSEEPAPDEPAEESEEETPTEGEEPDSEEPAPEPEDETPTESEGPPSEEPDEPAQPGLPPVEGVPEGTEQLDPEASAEGFFATIWLHRLLPDPTPPARRLSPQFARRLAAEAKRAHVSWALVLGVLRARGLANEWVRPTTVRNTARRLVELGARRAEMRALRAYRGSNAFAESAMALTRYNRAVGLHALVTGLKKAKPKLQHRVLHDSRIDIYPGGRLDVAMGRTDVRVLVLMRYLAEAHGQVTVSSLTTGHRLYARPGVVSAHVYGLAVDIAALSGRSIQGNQEVGGLTERGVRNVLLLPRELQPRQVISLLGLGGPSFPMANHHDHIHVGY